MLEIEQLEKERKVTNQISGGKYQKEGSLSLKQYQDLKIENIKKE